MRTGSPPSRRTGGRIRSQDTYRTALAQRMPEPDTGSLTADLTAFATALYGVREHPLRVGTPRGLRTPAARS